jgi:hypothetical protein
VDTAKVGASGPPGGKAPLDESLAGQAQLERSIRQPLGTEAPPSRRGSKGPRPTLTPPAFEPVKVQPATPPPAAELPASDLIRVPTRRLDAAQALALRLDHRAGFILSLVDGVSPVEAILDVCGMPRAEAVSIMKQLIGVGAIEIP